MHKPIVQYPVSKNAGPNRVLVTDENSKLPAGSAGAHADSHGSGESDAVSLDASQVASGVLDIARIPAAAMSFELDGNGDIQPI